MSDPTILADRRRRRIVWAGGVLVLLILAGAIAYSHERTRLHDPAAVAPASTVKTTDFEAYQRTHGARDEAQVAHDRAAYDAYLARHKAEADAAAAARPAEAPKR